MRHRVRGRKLGRNASHRKAMFRNMAVSLIRSTSPDEDEVNVPKVPGRIVTTLPKAKELRPMVEKLVTLGRKGAAIEKAASELASGAERNSAEWKKWRESDKWNQWNQAMAPAVACRRRAFAILRDHEAVNILFSDLAQKFEDRPGGYTRVIRLAEVRLGDGGQKAFIEFVGERDRVKTKKRSKPVVEDAPASPKAKADTEEAPKSPKGIGFDDLKVVEGIGPKCADALKAAGIANWKDLADSTPEKITEILTAAEGNFSGQVPTTWPEQAAMAVAGEWDKLEKWQDELDGGKPVEDA